MPNPSTAPAWAEPNASFHPCALIAIIAMQQCDDTFIPAGDVAQQSAVSVAGQTSTLAWVSGLVAVYIRAGGA